MGVRSAVILKASFKIKPNMNSQEMPLKQETVKTT